MTLLILTACFLAVLAASTAAYDDEHQEFGIYERVHGQPECESSKTTAFFLALFLGPTGADRFYLGYSGLGLLKLGLLLCAGCLFVLGLLSLSRRKQPSIPGAARTAPEGSVPLRDEDDRPTETETSAPTRSLIPAALLLTTAIVCFAVCIGFWSHDLVAILSNVLHNSNGTKLCRDL